MVPVLEKLLCPSRSLWRRVWQDRVSQHNTRPERPRPQRARPRPRRRPIFFWSEIGLVPRPTISHHIAGRYLYNVSRKLLKNQPFNRSDGEIQCRHRLTWARLWWRPVPEGARTEDIRPSFKLAHHQFVVANSSSVAMFSCRCSTGHCEMKRSSTAIYVA